MTDRVQIVIDADAHGAIEAARRAGAEIRALGNEARRAAGVWQDASGRWREANGRFVSSARQAEVGLKKVGDEAERTGRKTRDSAKAADAARAAFHRQGQTLNELGRAARYAGLAVGGLAITGLGAALKTGIHFNAQMESNRIALMQFTGSAEEADRLLKKLFLTAAKTPFQFQDVTRAARGLMAMGLPLKQTERTLKAIGDAVAGIGGGAPEIERAVLAFGQIQAKGKIQGQELLQLEQLGIPATRILKKELGLTADQLGNISRQGIEAGRGIQALTKGMEETFGSAAQRQSKTFLGQVSTLKDYTSMALGAMTQDLFHELEKWMPQVNKTAGDISKIWQRKDLTPEEKFRRSREAIERDLGPLFDHIADEWHRAHVGDKLMEAFNAALPKIAEFGAKAGLRLAEEVGKAFIAADPLGKLFIGGYLAHKLGAGSALGALLKSKGGAGSLVGGLTSKGGSPANPLWVAVVNGGVPGGAPVPGGGSKVGGALKTAGKALIGAGGAEAAAVAAPLLLADYVNSRSNLSKQASDLNQVLPAGKADLARQLDQAVKAADPAKLRAVAAALELTAQDMKATGGAAASASGDVRKMADDSRGLAKSIDNAATPAFRRMRESGGKNLSEIRQTVRDTTQAIKQRLGDDTQQGKDALAHNFELAAAAVRKSMAEGKVSTKTGLAEIERLMRQALAQYGISGKQATRYLSGQDTLTGVSDKIVKADGGFIGTPGERGADNVPIVVGRGEAVLNRHQQGPVNAALQATYGMGLGDLFDRTAHTRHYMASGGFAGLKPGVASAARRVLSRFPALAVTSTTGGTHAAGSYHYRGEAVDIAGPGMDEAAAWVKATMGAGLTEGIHNPNLSIKFGKSVPSSFWGASTWAGHRDHIHLAVAGALKMAGFSDSHIKRVMADGVGGALGGVVQGGLDRVRAGANARLKGIGFASGGFAGAPGFASGGFASGRYGLDKLRSLWDYAGGDPAFATLMAHVALAESSGRSGIVNGIGATGLWQIYPGGSRFLDPVANARAAVAKFNASRRAHSSAGGVSGLAPWLASVAGWRAWAGVRDSGAAIKTAIKGGSGIKKAPVSSAVGTGVAGLPSWSDATASGVLTFNEQAFLDFFDGQLAIADLDTPFSPYDPSSPADKPFDPATGLPADHNPARLDDDLLWAGRKAYLLENIYADRKARGAPVSVIGQIAQMVKSAREALSGLQSLHDAKQVPDTSARDSLVASLNAAQRDEALRKLALQGQQISVLSGFAPLLAGRFVGSFARGGLIKSDGLAMVHEGERITPSPQGPYGNTLAQNTTAPKVEVHIDGDVGPLIRNVRVMVDGQIQQAQSAQGRRARLISGVGAR